jgi:hypothetical protein
MTLNVRSSRLIFLAASALAIATLSGCVTTVPAPIHAAPIHTASATPTTTPTPTPTPVAAAIVLGAHGLAVESADHTALGQISFATDIATAATELAAATGEQPVVTPNPAQGVCGPRNDYAWGDLDLYTNQFTIGGSQFNVLVGNKNGGKTLGGLDILAPGAQGIGAKLSDALANVPGAIQASNGVLLDVQTDPNLGQWGVLLAQSSAGTVQMIYAPSPGGAHGSCE